MSKEFIVHLRNDDTVWKEYKHLFRYRGATIILSPVDKNTSKFQYSLCHKGDMFCRKTGVAKAREKLPVLVENKDIPKQIAKVRSYFFKEKDDPFMFDEQKTRVSYSDLQLSFKYLSSRRAA